MPVPPVFETYGPPAVIAETDGSGRVTSARTVPTVIRNDAGWRQALPRGSYPIARGGDTELGFSGRYHDFDQRGVYRCVGCRTALFRSADKRASADGWPSFSRTVAASNVAVYWDTSWGLRRRAVRCARCSSHIGHVFGDGPPPSRRRYCVNSASLEFVASGTRPGKPRQARTSPTTRPYTSVSRKSRPL